MAIVVLLRQPNMRNRRRGTNPTRPGLGHDGYACKRAWARDYKVRAGCFDCGYADSPVALQFDHVRGKKEFTVGRKFSTSWERLFREIEKCEVRCANCHAVRTHG